MTNHDIIVEQFEIYLSEHAKLTEKGIKASAARARKAIQNISRAGKERRKEIMVEKASIGA
jgi:hypothetical protein